MTWKITFLAPGLAVDFLPAIFVPASYLQGNLSDVGPLLGDGEIGRKHCHKIAGRRGFSGYLTWQ